MRNWMQFINRSRVSQSRRRRPGGRRRRLCPTNSRVLALESLESRDLLAAGDLDTTFNSSGTIPGIKFGTIGVSDDGNEGVETVVQADGKIVVATQTASPFDVLVGGYNPDGSLDSTFGTGGTTTFDFTTGTSLVRDVAIDSAGRIVVAGTIIISPGGQTRFAVARLNPDGSPDTSFDGDGKATAFSVNSVALAVAIQGNDKIVMGGYVNATTSARNFALARFDVNGTLDSTFGSGGLVITDFFGNQDEINDIAIQSDGRIVAAGFAFAGANPINNDFALARYNTDGTLDTTFDTDGRVNTNLVTSAQVSGLTSSLDIANAIRIQSDGRIVVAGFTAISGSTNETDMVVARYNTNGSLDTTLVPASGPSGSVSGTRRVNFNLASGDVARDLLIQPDGKYVLVGTSVNSSGTVATVALARLLNNDLLLPDGSLDNSFSGDGRFNKPASVPATRLAKREIMMPLCSPMAKLSSPGAASESRRRVSATISSPATRVV